MIGERSDRRRSKAGWSDTSWKEGSGRRGRDPASLRRNRRAGKIRAIPESPAMEPADPGATKGIETEDVPAATREASMNLNINQGRLKPWVG
jgi:hypothetical protein